MSAEALQWVKGIQSEDVYTQIILLILAIISDETASCFPSHQTIASRACLSARCVGMKLKSLEANGLIVRERRTNSFGHRKTDIIRLNLAFDTRLAAPRSAGNEDSLKAGDAARLPEPNSTRERPYLHPVASLTASGAEEKQLKKPLEQRLLSSRPTEELREDVNDLVETLWQKTPRRSRSRSSRAELSLAITAALKRGHAAVDIEAGVVAYFDTADARKEGGQYVKGIHRVIAQDRWASHLEERQLPSNSMKPAVNNTWRSRLTNYLSGSKFWNTTDWGPEPGKPACRVPAAVLIEFGLIGSIIPFPRAPGGAL